MSILVQLPSDWADPIIAAIHKAAPDIPAWQGSDNPRPDDVETILAWSLPPGAISCYPRLRFINSVSAGVDQLVATPDLPPDMLVTRVVDSQQQAHIARHVLAQALCHARELKTYSKQQRNGVWKRRPAREMSRCRVGILGLGEIGVTLARIFLAIDFPVAGWSRNRKEVPGVASYTGIEGLHAMLTVSDILVCTLPLTPNTRGVINRQALSMLPQGAYVINVGRGEHVVEKHLVEAIDKGHLAGAALDVFSKEPPDADDAVWNHPLIEATPHIAGDPSYELIAEQCIENVRRARDGRPLLHVVDRGAGY